MLKKIVGLFVLVVGAFCTMYAIHLMQRTHEAKQNISVVAVTDTSSNEPLNAIVGNILLKKVGENDRKQAYMLITGLAILISGGGMLLFFRNRT